MFFDTEYIPNYKKYIDYIDIVKNKVIPVVEGCKKEINKKVRKIFKLKSKQNKFYIFRCR